MPQPVGHLHLLCGTICAGKSTLSATLTNAPNTILMAEDDWLSTLFGAEMKTVADYVTYSARLQTALTPHIVKLLKNGANLVLDFPSNTPKQRAWAKSLIDQAACPHTLHFLDTPLETCKQRLHQRNAAGTHPFTVTDAQFDQISAHFTPPNADEGFTIQIHTP